METDPEPRDPLLDAVLQDDHWRTLDQELKSAAVGAFRRHRRRRRHFRWGVGALVLMAVTVTALYRPHPLLTAHHPRPEVQTIPSSDSDGVRYLPDDELLKLFPPGSCVLLEIAGRTRLVFLDPEVERTYLAPLAVR